MKCNADMSITGGFCQPLKRFAEPGFESLLVASKLLKSGIGFRLLKYDVHRDHLVRKTDVCGQLHIGFSKSSIVIGLG